LELFQTIARLLAAGGGSAWVVDNDGEFSLTVEFTPDGSASLIRGASQSRWVEFAPEEVKGFLALIRWVDSTFCIPGE
jgi:hypothetical protein